MRDLDDFLFVMGIAGFVLVCASPDNSFGFWLGLAQLFVGSVGLMILRGWQGRCRRAALQKEEEGRG